MNDTKHLPQVDTSLSIPVQVDPMTLSWSEPVDTEMPVPTKRFHRKPAGAPVEAGRSIGFGKLVLPNGYALGDLLLLGACLFLAIIDIAGFVIFVAVLND